MNAIETGGHHYYPFGTSASSWGNDAPKSKYTGHERDPHGAADYMMGRTCVFPFQRFMSVDPGRDGWNLYAYVGNDPIGYLDSTGYERLQAEIDRENRRLLSSGAEPAWVSEEVEPLQKPALEAMLLLSPVDETVIVLKSAQYLGRVARGGVNRVTGFFSRSAVRASAQTGGTRKGVEFFQRLTESSRPARLTRGRTKQWERNGGLEQAKKDFINMSPSNLKVDGSTIYGTLEDGSTVNFRPNSKYGTPTIEVQSGTNRKKIRYIDAARDES